ncbi:uncharacterized protein DC041_0007888, partial [Schistosoma bovis]
MHSSNNLIDDKCPMCSINMETWNTERKQLHKNTCCETFVNKMHSSNNLIDDKCPMCSINMETWNTERKQLHKNTCCETFASRTHLKRCASKLNMDLFSLMSLSCRDHRFIRHENEDLHTACALSLSLDEEVKQRKSEAILAQKIDPIDLDSPSHLLLSSEKRERIFAEKLESILLEECEQLSPKQSIKSENKCDTSELSPMFSNTLSKCSSYMTNIPSNPLLSMIGNNLCSDLCLILDEGDIIPAHKFIFAAWNLNIDYSQ